MHGVECWTILQVWKNWIHTPDSSSSFWYWLLGIWCKFMHSLGVRKIIVLVHYIHVDSHFSHDSAIQCSYLRLVFIRITTIFPSYMQFNLFEVLTLPRVLLYSTYFLLWNYKSTSPTYKINFFWISDSELYWLMDMSQPNVYLFGYAIVYTQLSAATQAHILICQINLFFFDIVSTRLLLYLLLWVGQYNSG